MLGGPALFYTVPWTTNRGRHGLACPSMRPRKVYKAALGWILVARRPPWQIIPPARERKPPRPSSKAR
ncbi:MAG: hypothetical protein Q6365_009360 [Candidatus Sigynarchaeota archaeon]